MTINFFKKRKDGWQRITERQIQRARTPEQLCNILKAADFSDIEYFSSTEFAKNPDTAERLWFVAQNK